MENGYGLHIFSGVDADEDGIRKQSRIERSDARGVPLVAPAEIEEPELVFVTGQEAAKLVPPPPKKIQPRCRVFRRKTNGRPGHYLSELYLTR